MKQRIQYRAYYGIAKKNIFGKLKVTGQVEVKTVLLFDDLRFSVCLYGIDRSDGNGPHDEKIRFSYDNIEEIIIDENLNYFDVVMKEGSTQIINDEEYYAKLSNKFFIDPNKIKDFYLILKQLSKFNFSDIKTNEEEEDNK